MRLVTWNTPSDNFVRTSVIIDHLQAVVAVIPEIVAPENEFAQVLWFANHPKHGAVAFPLGKNTFARPESGWRCPAGAAGTPHGYLLSVFGNLCGQSFETLHNRITTHSKLTRKRLGHP